ncbi:hypothetical protein CVO76_00515 [Arthrobacter agilis]|uniref:HTH araC/xylS-type domain-containing protein n=1 Tax=Arthrobacter agilis TaxID=37921 RepID=A0A2L0UIW3_9MICC|nr:hypothetical protein CVO76_00515 [Arthrobacter agilis]
MTPAGDLLQTPDTSVAQIARSVGYTNAYSFSTAFRRQVGVTPSEFRRHRAVLPAGLGCAVEVKIQRDAFGGG